VIVLENVCGTLTSHKGRDFTAICTTVQNTGYKIGAMIIDASLFLPQSRPRLFIVCLRRELKAPAICTSNDPVVPWHSKVIAAYDRLSQKARRDWIWWNVPLAPTRSSQFADLLEENPTDVSWFSKEQTDKLISQMSDGNRKKLAVAMQQGKKVVGCIYRRTRTDKEGHKVQRAEIRFDDTSGCLRTPGGGSSRQIVLMVDGKNVRARLISRRETARLMGLPDSYVLPENYNEAYHLTGDGVVVPVVAYLAQHLLEPLLLAVDRKTAAA
jgi:DNA (cytosine-5)-methyltransferase 1